MKIDYILLKLTLSFLIQYWLFVYWAYSWDNSPHMELITKAVNDLIK